ncbi:1-phosphofructokinase [Caenibacillus caldisaponilyticus]|uniref:1-phosphofructokinase n=1 Tax=Caenibacillus caldisaponilyticus TaxID=1674942 RepID=UPI0009884D23|nr:1-phosphofructokinase [Caenibacillus caldisaponilyticus]
MIATLTLNPSLDYFMRLEALNVGRLNRAIETAVRPGGKGINVSRVLKRLGVDSRAFGFIGGFTGDFIRRFLAEEGISAEFTVLEGLTRINVKISADRETELNGAPQPISQEDVERLLSVLGRLNAGDVFVMAGSVPASLPPDIYRRIIEKLPAGVKPVVDTSGRPLAEAIAARPYLIKPNRDELGQLFATDIQTVEETVLYAEKLLDEGVENVIVSLGADGALFMNREAALRASVPQGQIRSTVGSGDSLVAGFLAALEKGMAPAEAFRFGVAAGTATAFSDDLCTAEDVEKIWPRIALSTIREKRH